jgi:hypothetical protein
VERGRSNLALDYPPYRFQLVQYQRFDSEWKNIDIRFTDTDSQQRNLPFTTLLIGGNGLGKSFILSCLVDDFRLLESAIGTPRQMPLFEFQEEPHSVITYYINDDLFRVSLGQRRVIEITKNDKPVKSIPPILPAKLLAVAFMVNDKFPFNKETGPNDKSFYEYLGTRGASNASWTNTIGKKTAETIIRNASKPEFLSALGSILEDMDFHPIVEVFFEFDRLNQRTIDRFDYEYIEHQIKRRSDSSFSSADNFRESDIQEILEFVERMRTGSLLKQNALKYDIELRSSITNRDLQHEYPTLAKLNELRLISYPKLTFYKRSQPTRGFDFDSASSGEKHLLFSMVGLMANLQHGSLILIDEPELSLHPNWQTRYIHNLKRTLAKYHSCHIILATHSHLMVSDLESTTSSVVVLKETGLNQLRTIEAEPLQYSTYGWSAENILLEVFEMPSTRNYYLSKEISEVLVEVSDSTKPIKASTRQKIARLAEISKSLKDIDPLKKIIETLEQLVK